MLSEMLRNTNVVLRMNDYINFSISKSEAMVIFRLGLNIFHFCKLYLCCKFKHKSLSETFL